MTTYRYKNVADQKLIIVGVGTVEAGKVLEYAEPVENPNLDLVSDKKKTLNKEAGDVD